MRIPPPRRRRLSAGLALLACAGLPAAARGQVQPRPDPEAFCWTARPAESCRAFLVAEAGVHAVVAGSSYLREGFDGRRTRSRHLAPHAAWEAGVMRNLTARDAAGGSVLVGGDANGIRLALKARYRRWLGGGAALDAGGGALVARRAEPYAEPEPGNDHVAVSGLTGDVALGLAEWAAVSVRGDLLFDADGERASAVYGGLKLGTRPSLVGTALPLVAAGLIFLVAGGGS